MELPAPRFLFQALCFTALAASAFAAPPLPPSRPMPAEGLEKLAGRRIFFGHQSVGQQLMIDVRWMLADSPGGPQAIHGDDPKMLAEPAWVHTEIGQNGDPHGKIRHFRELMDKGFGDRADIAMFKFCFLDIDEKRDVDRLFADYRSTLADLKRRYPRTTFVHVTAPLTTVGRGLKSSLKHLLGMRVWGEEENLRRAKYNALLHQAYDGSEPVFDLAALESTRPDGSRETFERGGVDVPALVASYSSDGAHLAPAAAERIARALLDFLAQLPPPGSRVR